MKISPVLALVFCVGAVGCTPPVAQYACRFDADCSAGSVCVDQLCSAAREGEGEVEPDAGPSDAGFDAGPSDAGFDAGPSDAGFDAGPSDAGFDAGPRDGGFDAGIADDGGDAGASLCAAANDVVDVRYVRLTFSGTNWLSFAELSAVGPGDEVLPMSVVDQSEEYFEQGEWSAEATTDGDTATCYSTATSDQDSAWIEYDLGGVESVARFVLNNLDNCAYGPVTSVSVEAATQDGDEWIQVVAPRGVGQQIEELPIVCP